ncbi:MAG TPA: MaoC/PaaZ C-terminal domain-containing protein [Actinomycetota bacterium]|jgi:acyl dehydratase
MGTFSDVEVGESFSSPVRELTEDDVASLIRIGGYTHPLFTDPAFAAATRFGRTPMPGEGILHVMGGLAEQTGRFDDSVIALIGFEDVRFRAPAFAGDTLRLEIEVLGKEPKGDRGVLIMAWRCLDARDQVVCEARARMLFRI